MVTEQMDGDGYWVTIEGDGEVGACAVCFEPIWWQSCDTGGWWIHETHPGDHHDAADAIEQENILARQASFRQSWCSDVPDAQMVMIQVSPTVWVTLGHVAAIEWDGNAAKVFLIGGATVWATKFPTLDALMATIGGAYALADGRDLA